MGGLDNALETMTKHCTSNCAISISRSKHFLLLHFAVGQVLSISGYDLENGTSWWKSWFWFCSAFVYFTDLKTIYFASCLCCSCKLFYLYRPLQMVLAGFQWLKVVLARFSWFLRWFLHVLDGFRLF